MPKRIVTPRRARVRFRSPKRKYPLARFRVAEDHTRVTRLNRGSPSGLIGLTPIGGQQAPTKALGDHAMCPQAQKNLKKKQTSEAIKSTTDVVRQAVTPSVWTPHRVPSRVRSEIQKYTQYSSTGKAPTRKAPCPTQTHEINPRGRPARLNLANAGKGLGSTRAQGLARIGNNIICQEGYPPFLPDANWISSKTA